MRHVLVSSEGPDLEEALRAVAAPTTTFLLASGVDDTLERLARSARIDVVVTDDPAIEAAIREEIPGSLPIYVASADESPASILSGLDALRTA